MCDRVLYLTGEVETVELRFALTRGEHIAGSGGECALVVPARGVSRRHARFVVDDGGCTVEDLESKNGVRVNGRAVSSAPLRVGDQVFLGPVGLSVEEIDVDDAVLAFEIHDQSADGMPPEQALTTSVHGGGREVAVSAVGIQAADRMAAEILGGRQPAGASALSIVAELVCAQAAGLVETERDGAPTVLAWGGDPAGIEGVPKILASRAIPHNRTAQIEVLRGVSDDGRAYALAAAELEDGLARGLIVLDPKAPRTVLDATLRLALRLLCCRRAPDSRRAGAEEGTTRPDLRFDDSELECRSAGMVDLYRRLAQLKDSSLPVLVTGETGVGKEHVVRLLHRSSQRAGGPFEVVNCAAIPADLLEAELFGIRGGVATGVAERAGCFERAHGGLVFLDEVGEMSDALQAKVLRVLQDHQVRRVGGDRPVTVDVRVLAATNSDLEQRVADGQFRADLFYRIAGVVLRVPPLRERRQDIPALVEHFMASVSTEVGRAPRGVTVRALEAITEYQWPGNVRELQHEIRRLAVACGNRAVVHLDNLPTHIARPDESGARGAGGLSQLNLGMRIEQLERQLIGEALRVSGGNRSTAAAKLGVSRAGLRMKMRRLGLTTETTVRSDADHPGPNDAE